MKTRHGLIALTFLAAASLTAVADGTYQAVDYGQDWTNTGLITVDDNWSGVPGVIGYRGDNLTAGTGVDPTTLTAADDPGVVDVNSNRTSPSTFFTGGVAEFDTAGIQAVALNGSGTADAPYIKLHLNTTGSSALNLSYTLIDLDPVDDAVMQVCAQYRTGGAGAWTNITGTYTADATTSGFGGTTNVSAPLPGGALNQSQLQIRIMTTNAIGNDEWVGVDNIAVSAPVTAPAGGVVTMVVLALLTATAGVLVTRRRATSVA